MKCSRCSATMIVTFPLTCFAQPQDRPSVRPGTFEPPAWHCLICGNYEDGVVLTNRRAQQLVRRRQAALRLGNEAELVAEAEAIAQRAFLGTDGEAVAV